MTPGIVTAGGGHAWEPEVVSELSRPAAPLVVVRRCADIADILAVASTGQVVVALVSADLRRLDTDSVQQLAVFGVGVVAVHRAGDDRTQGVLERIGVAATVSAADGPAAMVAAVQDVATRRRDRGDGADAGSEEADGLLPPGRPGVGSGNTDGFGTVGGTSGAAFDETRAPSGSPRGPVRRLAGGEPAARFVPSTTAEGDVEEARPQDPGRSAALPRRHRVDGADSAIGIAKRRRHGAGRRHRNSGGDRGRRAAERGEVTVPSPEAQRPPQVERPQGRVIAVWGPVGAPGRSTVAMGLADQAVASGLSVMLVDADVYGGVLANAFGLLDESAGLAGACRLAANGRLGRDELAELCWHVREGLVLLTGIARADRWPEVRPSAIPLVLSTAAALADVVIVDCAAVLEMDEEITFDTLAPRRNGATVEVLCAADLVIAVGAGDPAGMERLARGFQELSEVADETELRLVINRVRAGAASPTELRDAAARFCGLEPVAFLPDDRASVDLAWQRGVSLSEVAAKSALVSALGLLSRQVLSPPG